MIAKVVAKGIQLELENEDILLLLKKHPLFQRRGSIFR